MAGASSETLSEITSHTEEAFSTQPGLLLNQEQVLELLLRQFLIPEPVIIMVSSQCIIILQFFTLHLSDNMTEFGLLKCSFSSYIAQSTAVVYELLCRHLAYTGM